MEELKKKLMERIAKIENEAVLLDVERLLNRQQEIQKLGEFMVESKIEEIEDDEFVNRAEAERLASSALKTKKGPRL